MVPNTTFGEFIREERTRADLGLREAARILGISAGYLSRLEADEFKPPSGALLLRMAKTYGVDIKKLLDLAKIRQGEVMTADSDVAPAIQAFYRIAYDQSPEMQDAMLEGALGALKLPEEKKLQILRELRAIISRAKSNDLPRRSIGDDGLFAFDISPRFLSRECIRNLALDVLGRVFGIEIPIPVPLETVIDRLDREIILVVHNQLDGGTLRDGSPAVLGLSRWSRDGRRRELVIHEELFEAQDTSTRRRANFTIAHELFHCIEHLPIIQNRNPELALARKIGYVTLASELTGKPWYHQRKNPRRLSSREDWREWQANTFAAELLMPSSIVADAFHELFGSGPLVAESDCLDKVADQAARMITGDDFGRESSLVDRFDVNPQAMAIRLVSLGLVVGGK